MKFQELLIDGFRQFEQQIAIKYQSQSISYHDLLQASDKVTGALLSSGIKSGEFVGILLDDRIDIIISIIGVINAGGIFVPLDRSLPSSKFADLTSQVMFSAWITSAEIDTASPGGKKLIIEDIKKEAAQPIDYPPVDEEDSLYVYFTSGSTGTPKGIVGKNKSLAQFIQWEIKAFGLNSETTGSQLISPYFDAFLRDVFAPLIAGGTLNIPPNHEELLTPEHLISWIDEEKISLIHCVPSVFRVFNQEDQINPENFTHLRHVLMSGEKIIPGELKSWFETFNDRIQLVNLYGTTEATMIRSVYLIQPDDVRRAKMPIGGPIDDTDLLVMTGKDQESEAGLLVPGELYIRSEYLTKGYLNNEELNKERFVEVDGKPAFRTGDKARKLQDGNLELLGREDRQVKVRGVRVELDEIEHTLAKFDVVKEIVVVPREVDGQITEILAFFTPAGDLSVQPNLEAFATEHLAVYTRPSQYIGMTQFPTLPSGKVDLKKLLALGEEQNREVIAPSNEVEEQLLQLWNDLLGNQELSVTDNFLKVGGNSLSLMRLIAKIYGAFSVRIPLGQLFKNLTIQQQATFIMELASDSEGMAISKASEKEWYHVTTAQERMYIQQSLNKFDTSYNLPYVVKIEGTPDITRLENTFKQLLQRHESLRTIFKSNEDGIFQKVQKSFDFSLEAVKSVDLDQTIQDFIQPFDLAAGPVIRAAKIHLDTGENYLIMDVHHIVCDGISQSLFFYDFIQLYHESQMEPLPLQYKDFAEWERSYLQTDAYQGLREFWLESLQNGVPSLNLPLLPDADVVSINEGSNQRFSLPVSVVSPVIDQLKSQNITNFSMMYTYFIVFLMQLTGKDNFAVGIASSGRVHEEVQRIIGMFVKTLPIRIKIDIHQSIRELFKTVNDHLQKALSCELYDLSDIIKELNKVEQGKGDQLFEVMFTYQNYQSEEIRELGKDFEPYYFEKTESKFPINMIVEEAEDTFEINFEYSQKHFRESDVPGLMELFETIVEKSAINLDQTLFEIITEEESVADIEDDIQFNF